MPSDLYWNAGFFLASATNAVPAATDIKAVVRRRQDGVFIWSRLLKLVARRQYLSRSTDRFQAPERPRAGAELVDFNSQALQHRHVEIAKRRGFLRIEAQVLPVPEAAARQEDRQVFDGVAAAVTQVAAQEDHRPVEQAGALFLRRLQLGEQVADELHRLDLDDLQLRQLPRVLAVVRQVV